MDSNKTIKKLFATLTLSCGLMTSGLMAAELPFTKSLKLLPNKDDAYANNDKNYMVVRFLKDGAYYYRGAHFRGPLITPKIYDWSDTGENIKVGDFVCSSETAFVLYKLGHIELESKSIRPENRETERAFNKFFRNENDYTLWHESLSRYDFAKGFNLYEKLQIKDELFTSDILSFQYVESNGVIPNKVGLKDIDAFIEIYDGYKDFIPAKAKELVAIEINHKQKVLEYACAPVQKIQKGEDEYGDFSYRITFDETKVIQRIEDLDPQKVLKFIPEELKQYLK